MTDGHLQVRGLRAALGGAAVLNGVDLEVDAGKVVALLGPSGSGKTTLLRCLAGLERPAAGTVRLGSAVLSDAGPPPAFVEPERRGVGMVFQDWALFPHLDVAGNVGFGLPRSERGGRRVAEVLELVGLSGFERRPVPSLSGGQQQRVALARALAPRPSVLLLDEPFSNLDAALRAQVRGEVQSLLAEVGITTVFVTHDRDEAFVLGDEVAVLREGRVVQQGTGPAVYRRPVDPWVAGFVGAANLLDGHARGDTAATALGAVRLAEPHTGPVRVLVRPEEVVLQPGGAGVVRRVEFLGHDHVVEVDLDGIAVQVRTRERRWHPGDLVDAAAAVDAAPAWPPPAGAVR